MLAQTWREDHKCHACRLNFSPHVFHVGGYKWVCSVDGCHEGWNPLMMALLSGASGCGCDSILLSQQVMANTHCGHRLVPQSYNRVLPTGKTTSLGLGHMWAGPRWTPPALYPSSSSSPKHASPRDTNLLTDIIAFFVLSNMMSDKLWCHLRTLKDP